MGKLFLVPTPIGNLGDITFRAVDTLNLSDLILAEDTRTSSKLLNHYKIQKPIRSFHMHNEHRKLSEVISKLKSGQTIAIISDAGTPGISDPGFLLVREALANDIEVVCLPGPTALIPALIQSGLSADRFVFEGFLPPKKGRNKRLENLIGETRTIIFYESPHKILKTLTQLVDFFEPERRVSISRELSKMYEETFRGNLGEAVEYFNQQTPKGEFVICLAGA
tara:strand:- start:21862 stop:22530 length:669 start_codon:yes stop_codon:yes gene_type:complete